MVVESVWQETGDHHAVPYVMLVLADGTRMFDCVIDLVVIGSPRGRVTEIADGLIRTECGELTFRTGYPTTWDLETVWWVEWEEMTDESARR